MEEVAELCEAGATTVFLQRVRFDDASEQSLAGVGGPRTLSNVHRSPLKGVVFVMVEFGFSRGFQVWCLHAQSVSRHKESWWSLSFGQGSARASLK